MFDIKIILEKYTEPREDEIEMKKEGIKTLEEYRLFLKFKEGIDDTWLIV